MSYATQADLTERFGTDELEALAPDGMGGIDATRTSAAIADAVAEMNSYLGRRYSVPVVNGGPVLLACCCDIARFYLYTSSPTEEVQQRYQSRVAWLKDVAADRATLGAAEEAADDDTGRAISRTSNTRTFTKDTLAGF